MYTLLLQHVSDTHTHTACYSDGGAEEGGKRKPRIKEGLKGNKKGKDGNTYHVPLAVD